MLYFILLLFRLIFKPHVSTDVMVLRYLLFLLGSKMENRTVALVLLCYRFYLFIFSSGMEYRNLSQMCGKLYLPLFLFRVGLFTLIHMAYLMTLAMLFPSLPIILKLSIDVVWPLLL